MHDAVRAIAGSSYPNSGRRAARAITFVAASVIALIALAQLTAHPFVLDLTSIAVRG